ncbi:receptor-transporting protein 3 isoform X2 [Strongylocentrotus purpuratus]|uniref:3CxxC-type domain-containing protein n=1 Tax=Strongylocentrotus purpuratus TaxID=7668 RepID=A0A7M7HNF1_STRPU|nr:receptor-transporting protein 3 isoform X2 [Strongylocentrotus purpuratus]|eukprot:XP_011680521.1 PREDICTED: receptor-transporting protein 3 isoform X3 [Strongylocentrotus purpuratus]
MDYVADYSQCLDPLVSQGCAIGNAPMFYTDRMDEIWFGEFAKVFAPYLPNIWNLTPTEICPSTRWRRFKDSAKVRFCCQTCGHGWTSMKGRVVFWYFFHVPYCEGHVQFKLYGQQCQRCNNGMFEPAMWYPEEVNKVLCNLYNRIGQTYYGFVKPPIRYDRRAGKPRTQHNATLCQACRDGECDSRPRAQGQPTKVVQYTTTGTTTTTTQQQLNQQLPPPPATVVNTIAAPPISVRKVLTRT